MRAAWKKPFVDYELIKEVKNSKVLRDRKAPLKIRSKNSTIFPAFIGLTVSILNGNKFSNIIITEAMVGHKLGEFVFTKKHPFKKR